MGKDDFYIINSWMIDELNLSGIELQVFAIIWSLSRGEKQAYIAGNSHLVKMTKKSEPTIIATLKKLCEKGVIEKIPVVVNNVERNYYKAISGGTKEILGGYLKNLSGGTKEILAPNKKEIYKEKKKEKRLSNDNQKNEYSEEFETFWKLYDYPKDKKTAYSRWNHLSKQEKELAVKALPAYFEDCARCKRSKQHPSTYLNKRTWEDDFTQKQKVAFYDPLETDIDEKKRFKEWMRNNHPEIENTALPLSYEDYMKLVGKNYERVYLINTILDEIDREIWKYRKSDIATIIRQEVRKEEADD